MKEAEILAGAKGRIEKYRTGELKVKVVDKQGKPVPEARVEVKQKRHEYLFGCHLYLGSRRWRRRRRHFDAKKRAAYLKHFEALHNYASLGFTWAYFEPEPGQPQHADMDRQLKWCEKRDITVQGHLVMWNHDVSSPKWLPEDPVEIGRLADERVRDITTTYRGRVKYYILVNEATDCFRAKSTDKLSYQGGVTRAWRHFERVPFAKRFFYIAQECDPEAGHLINDYRVDKPYERLIEKLVDEQGRPLYDVVGIQSHMHYRYWGARKLWDVMERFARFGKPLHFTENTQISGRGRKGKNIKWRLQDPNWKTTKAGEKRQADIVEELYTLIFSHPATEAISWFGLVDYGWLGAPGGLLHWEDFSPKPAYERLHGLIKGEWWTQAREETNGRGKCAVRAFWGDYEITAKKGRATAKAAYKHTKGQKGEVEIVI